MLKIRVFLAIILCTFLIPNMGAMELTKELRSPNSSQLIISETSCSEPCLFTTLPLEIYPQVFRQLSIKECGNLRATANFFSKLLGGQLIVQISKENENRITQILKQLDSQTNALKIILPEITFAEMMVLIPRFHAFPFLHCIKINAYELPYGSLFRWKNLQKEIREKYGHIEDISLEQFVHLLEIVTLPDSSLKNIIFETDEFSPQGFFRVIEGCQANSDPKTIKVKNGKFNCSITLKEKKIEIKSYQKEEGNEEEWNLERTWNNRNENIFIPCNMGALGPAHQIMFHGNNTNMGPPPNSIQILLLSYQTITILPGTGPRTIILPEKD